MNNNSWFKKEMPLQTVIGFGGGATGFGAHSSAVSKTYVDEVFSTYVYEGTGGANTVNTGLDISGEGGLVWVKNRTNARNSMLFDTVRGVNQEIATQSTSAENDNTSLNQTFTSTGFTFNTSNLDVNSSSYDYASWSFRKAPGFFTIKQYTGSGSTQSLTHDLGSIPGCIMVKRTDSSADWGVYHRGQNGGVDPEDYRLRLNTSTTENNDTYWGDTAPTATHFTVGDAHTEVNLSGATYIAYIFAGGKGTTDKAVDFDGTGDYLSLASSSDFTYGTGDFTCEGWMKPDVASSAYLVNHGNDNFSCGINSAGKWFYYNSTTGIKEAGTPTAGQWYHFAVARSSGTTKIFINGIETSSFADSHNYSSDQATTIGSYTGGSSNTVDGLISNVRIVKGQALYTTNFNVPHDPLTTTSQGAYSSNVKLLCCNGATAAASTVTPGTITANGDPTVTTNSSIFDDTSANVFGDSGDQNVIKMGSYIGNGSTDGPEIYLGWEPQWVMIKRTDVTKNWYMQDSMRGIATGGNDAFLLADSADAEQNTIDILDLTPRGFNITHASPSFNADGGSYVYMALRRPDGYVGKPIELGTDVFAMDPTISVGVFPQFTSGFPVDFSLTREPDVSGTWYGFHTGARLLQGAYQLTSTSGAWASGGNFQYDYNDGIFIGNWSDYMSWMWKRHAGFDVVTYDGLSGVREIPHSLGKPAEMIWIKRRDGSEEWAVGHSGMDSGGWNKYMKLNSTDAEANAYGTFNSTAPTATHFSLSTSSRANYTNQTYIAMLFASTDVSKVGSYTGNGSSGHAITVGFQPRFLIVKAATTTSDWSVFDTTRGWASGNDKQLALNSDAAQVTSYDYADPTSTGFTINITGNAMNGNGETYVYYTHA